MVFHTTFFLIVYLPLTVLIYHVIPGRFVRGRNVILLLMSLLFYAWGDPIYVLLLLYGIVCNYLLGRDIERKLAKNRPRSAGRAVIFGLVLNGFILGFFKYYPLLIHGLETLFKTELPVKELGLPLGVSFYTLQAIAYLLDIWEGKCEAIRDPIQMGLLLVMFPKLLMGPLVETRDMVEQFSKRRETLATFGGGLSRFITGLAKKVILADTIGVVWNNISAFAPGELSVLTAWIGAFAFGFELYFNFSGYADMALGLGAMFGIALPENMAYPFTAKSIGEFWRRWNVTVTRWFRERLFPALGGGAKFYGPRARAQFLTWVLLGLWYGASWHYLVWGALMGMILVMERYAIGARVQRLPEILRRIYTILIVTVLWALFAKDTVAEGFRYMGSMFGAGKGILDAAGWYYLRTNLVLFIVLIMGSTTIGKRLKDQYLRTSDTGGIVLNVAGYVLLAVISFAYVVAQQA